MLWELRDRDLIRFRCHVGHVYSAESLVSEQADAVEVALWSALRALEERAALARRMAHHAQAQGHQYSVEQFMRRANDTARQAAVLRELVLKQDGKHLSEE